MLRQIIGYIPSNVVPAVISFATIYLYTRILTPAAFGAYSLVFTIVLIAQTSFFNALPLAVLRFLPGADLAGRRDGYLKETYSVFYAIAVIVVAGFAAVSLMLGPNQSHLLHFAAPLLLVRSAVAVNQAINRASDRMWRYNVIECAHAILGLLFGLLFIFTIGRSTEAVLLGLMTSAGLCALADIGLMLAPFRRVAGPINWKNLFQLVNYTWPLVTVAITASLLQLSDRFIVGTLGSAAMLGIYAVAYSLVERPTSLISSSVTIATFSMAVRVLETDGRDAGRIQAGKNGAVLLAMVIPACVGLAMTSPNIAAVLVGPEFREGVAALIPIMCFTALCHGVRAHFVDHAFHLAGRPDLMLWTYAPAALANIIINLLMVPHYGMFAAAWAGLVCQVGAAIGGWFVGRRVFPLWLPLGQVFKVIAAAVPMVLALSLFQFPLTWLGLLMAVAVGAGVFGLGAVLLDAGGIRSSLRPAPGI